MNTSNPYKQLRAQAKNYYESIDHLYSPALGGLIHFGDDGFNHLIFRNARRERDRSEQLQRFNLLGVATKLIRLSTTHQEYEERKMSVPAQKYKKRTRKTSAVLYWGIIAIIDQQKIKVVIRKVGTNGNFHFWSVIPNWNTSTHRDAQLFKLKNITFS